MWNDEIDEMIMEDEREEHYERDYDDCEDDMYEEEAKEYRRNIMDTQSSLFRK